MAESITKFGAVDENFSSTISKMEGRLEGFEGAVNKTSGSTIAATAALAAKAAAVAALAAAAAAATGTIVAFKTAIDIADRLDDLSKRTGETVGNLSLLERAFENAGLKASDVGPALSRLQNIIGEAAGGSDKAIEKLESLGLTFDQLKNKSPNEQLELVAQKIAELPTQSERAAAAIDFFGQSLGPKMLPIIEDFAKEMAKAQEQLGSFPRIIDTYAPSLTRLSDALAALESKPGQFAVGFAGPMADILANLAEKFATFDAAALGEKIGLAFKDIVVKALIFIEDLTLLLRGIWDGMKDSAQPVIDAIGQAFADLKQTVRPYIEGIGEFFNNIDYAAIGRQIGEQFGFALDVAKGLWADPVAIFGLYGDYLNFTFRQAGDTFLSVFVTAVEALGRVWAGIMSPEFFEGIAKIFMGAIIMGIGVINERFLAMFESVFKFFTELWNSITSKSVGNFASQLWEMVKGFAKSFLDALTSPARLISGALGSALMESTADAAKRYQTDFDSAHGSIIAKARAGMDGMAREGASMMTEGFNQATGALTDGVKSAVTETQGFKSNIFGSVEAGEQLRQKAEAIAAKGKEYFQDVSSAGGHIKEAKLDVTGTGGISPALEANAKTLNETASKTSSASKDTVAAFNTAKGAGEKLETNLKNSAINFGREVLESGRLFKQDVTAAMGELTSFTKGLATEATLRQAVDELRRLNQKLPQPALVP